MAKLDLLKTWTKTPRERMDYDVSFREWLAKEGDTPAAVNPLSVTVETGITLESFTFVAGVAKVWVSGGVAGGAYRVTLQLTTSGGRIKESEFEIAVREK